MESIWLLDAELSLSYLLQLYDNLVHIQVYFLGIKLLRIK